jgi:hypothetical protein
MTCPRCRQQPLSLAQFLLKPQVVRLRCRQCGARLSMPAGFKWLFAGWVLMTLVVLRFGTANLPLPHYGLFTPRWLLLFLVTIIVPAAMLAMVFRLIVWRREYRCVEPGARPRAVATEQSNL